MAVIQSTEMINFCFSAMANAELSKAPEVPPPGNMIAFKAAEMSATDRRAAYQAWILARGFHDVLRGAKETLEQARVYLELLDKQPSTQEQSDLTSRIKRKAQHASFEELLTLVDKRLSVPLQFPSALLSLQQARNCLEHRGDIVGREDCKGAARFRLSYPRLKLFYLREGVEVELVEVTVVDPGEGQTHANIMLRIELKTRDLAMNERLTLSAAEFNLIAFAVMQLGDHVANRLPPIPT